MQSVLDERTGTTEAQGSNESAQKLFAAVTDGDLAQVQQLLPLNHSTSTPSSLTVNIADSAGFTPLIIASRLAHVELVRFLLSHPAIDVNAHTHQYNTAFLYAAAKGNLELVRLLLEHGADFFFTNANNDTALMCATTAGNMDTVEFLLDAFHSIQRAKVAHSGGGGVSHKRWVTLKNEEGLTTLMCAAMSGSLPLVRLVLAEARRELAIHMPSVQLVPSGEPSALTQFYPSIWPEVLGSVQFDSHSSGGYVDPAPAAFQSFVNAQNLMGDTALHIAAQNQNVDLFFLLVDNAGADPMKMNRRGRRSFELFATPEQEASAAAAPAASADGSAAATTAAADGASPSASTSSSAPDVQEALTDHLEKVIEFQRLCRVDYVQQQLSNSEKLFSELMEEEEEQQAAQSRRKKPSKAKIEVIEKKPKKAKKKAVAPASAGKSDGAAAASVSEASSPSSSPRLTAAASPAAPAPTVVAASSAVSSATADLSSGDSASGWEVVAPKAAKHAKAGGKQTQQQQHPPVHAAPAVQPSVAAGTAAGVSEKKKAAAPGSPKPPRKPKAQAKAAQATSARKEDAPVSAPVAAPAFVAARTAASSPTFVPAFTLVPSNTPAAPVTAAKPPAAIAPAAAAPAAAPAAADPAPSSSFFAAFSSRPRAWRPITALQPRRSPPPTESSTNATMAAAVTASSSSSDALASLQSQFSALHPHIEYTDLQLSHLLGSDWSGLSMSQLSVLEEVYATLGRQIRDTQFQLFQQQQQEIMSELVRTKSEVHALRKQVDSASANKTEQ